MNAPAPAPGQAAGIDPWRALRFALDGLERICMGTADEADSSSIAEKALFAAIGHLNVRDIPDSAVAAQEQPAPASASQVRRHEAQAAAAPAPGQAAYEAHAGKMGGRRDAWGELPATYRDAWEAAEQAAVRATPLYAELAKQLAEAVAAQEPRPAPELQAGPCPFDGHDGEHLRLNTHGHWLCAINLTNMLVAADVITDLQPERPAPELAEVTAERDGLRKALHVIRLGIAEPPPESVAEDALNGRYFDPMNDAGVWRTEPALKAVPAPDALRAGIRELLADIQASADATRPSKKTQTEDEVAAQLRQLLEEA